MTTIHEEVEVVVDDDKSTKLLSKARRAIRDGRLRKAAEFCWEAFVEIPSGAEKIGTTTTSLKDYDNWYSKRYQAIRCYLSVLEHQDFPCEAKDLKHLERIGQGQDYDTSSSVLIRSEVLLSFAILKGHQGERHSCADACRIAIDLIEKTPKWEKNMWAGTHIHISYDEQEAETEMLRVGELLAVNKEHAKGLLDIMERGADPGFVKEAAKRWDDKSPGAYFYKNQHKDLLLDCSLLPKKDLAKLVPRLEVGGNACDYCFKTRKEQGVATLKVCGRCHLYYYCSQECLTAAWWDGGHKEVCRHRKSVSVGDIMQVLGQKEILLVEILGVNSNRDGYWQAQLLSDNTDEIKSYPASNLNHIRHFYEPVD